MTEEKWLNLLSMIEESFGVAERRKNPLSEEDGPGEVETVEFKGPLGKMKLIRTIRPLILNKKTLYSKRGGSDTAVDYVYSDTETVTNLKAYRFDDSQNDWQEIDPGTFARSD